MESIGLLINFFFTNASCMSQNGRIGPTGMDTGRRWHFNAKPDCDVGLSHVVPSLVSLGLLACDHGHLKPVLSTLDQRSLHAPLVTFQDRLDEIQGREYVIISHFLLWPIWPSTSCDRHECLTLCPSPGANGPCCLWLTPIRFEALSCSVQSPA